MTDLLAALAADPEIAPRQPGEYTAREMADKLGYSYAGLAKKLERGLGLLYERRRSVVKGKACWLWRLKE